MSESRSLWRSVDPTLLLNEIPSGVVVIDAELRIVDHNRAFTEIFGEARGRTCHQVTRGRDQPCPGCPVRSTLQDGRSRVVEQLGRDRFGHEIYYLFKVTPLPGDDGRITRVAAVTTDLTATKRLQREYQTLFETVPCFVTVVNREHRVVKANEAFRRTFGETTGEHCYRLCARRHEPCRDCPVDRTFADHQRHSSLKVGVSREGFTTPYVVHTAPLIEDEGRVSHVVAMGLDMRETERLRKELGWADVLRRALVEHSPDAVVVLDENRRVVLSNPAAEELLGRPLHQMPGRRLPKRLIPEPLRAVLSGERGSVLLERVEIERAGGEAMQVRLTAVGLEVEGRFLGSVLFARDARGETVSEGRGTAPVATDRGIT